jgi:hypothetical protein
MKNKIFTALFLMAVLAIATPGAFAYCLGGFAHQFYGDLKINGVNALAPTQIKASINGVESLYTTSVNGKYGSETTDDKFAVYGDAAGYTDAPTIHFYAYINGGWVDSGETYTYLCGDTSRVDINVEYSAPLDSDGDGVPDSTDNCDSVANPGQEDVDNDGIGNACDSCTDIDLDGFCAQDDDCNDNNALINPDASDVVCNGVDNDCDGTADDGYVSTPTSCGVGACASTGSTSCVAGVVHNSCTAGTPAANDATCNNVDDDCNGVKDEDYVSTPTSCGVGACAAAGSTSCVAGVVQNSCVAGTPGTETCDEDDNDCDGLVYEGGVCDECTNGATKQCGPTTDVGACAYGLQTCTGGAWGACVGAVYSATETCNGLDDDCDGSTDEGLTAPLNSKQSGVCAASTKTCTGVGGWMDDYSGIVTYEDPETSCDDSLDNDCDGSVNEGCAGTYPVSIQIYDGWTLFALPFQPAGVSNSEQLGQAIKTETGLNCDVIMKFNGATQQMVDDIIGLADPSFAVVGTEGYFIHCDGSEVFNYNGVVWS